MSRAISDLSTLLGSMDPVLDPRTFVFVTMPEAPGDLASKAIMTFKEKEGITLILEEGDATGLEAVFESRMITLNVHSALEAVGFLAAIVPRLAEAGMGVNPVAAFHHDHLFIPAGRAEDAMAILKAIAAEAKSA